MRSTKIFGLAAALLLSTVMIGGLWSQGLDVPGGWVSPQNQATSGRYRSAADDFIRPDSYTSAKVENWFAFTSFAINTSFPGANIGYAKKLEKVYIAAYYGGTFWSNLFNDNYAEQNVAAFAGGTNKTVPVYSSATGVLPTLSTTNIPNNRFAILFGAADMGFRLSLKTNHDSFKKNDFATYETTGDTYTGRYKSYETERGFITPQLAWSMAKNLSDNGVKPYATLDLGFVRDYTKSVAYDGTTKDTTGDNVTNSQNYFEPILMFGLGGYTFFRKSGFSATADLDNTLTLRAYDNEVRYGSGTVASPYKTVSIKGTWDGTTAMERTYVQDVISPSLAGSWSGGPLALKFKFNLPVTLRGEEQTRVTPNASGKLEKSSYDDTVSYIGFAPNLRLAAQWKCLPNRLTLNAGARIDLGGTLSRTTTEGDSYSGGNKQPNSSRTTIVDTKGSTGNQLYLGVTFTPTENLFFEATCGGTAGAMDSNNIKVFSNGNDGLFSFGGILVGLKF